MQTRANTVRENGTNVVGESDLGRHLIKACRARGRIEVLPPDAFTARPDASRPTAPHKGCGSGVPSFGRPREGSLRRVRALERLSFRRN
jgi:hypothetical protein